MSGACARPRRRLVVSLVVSALFAAVGWQGWLSVARARVAAKSRQLDALNRAHRDRVARSGELARLRLEVAELERRREEMADRLDPQPAAFPTRLRRLSTLADASGLEVVSIRPSRESTDPAGRDPAIHLEATGEFFAIVRFLEAAARAREHVENVGLDAADDAATRPRLRFTGVFARERRRASMDHARPDHTRAVEGVVLP
jgi:Tfp pilus assembly protein PilO